MAKKPGSASRPSLIGDAAEAAVDKSGQVLEWGLPLVTGLGIFLIYLRTLAPTIVGGDTGELITVAYKMGVAHPPGYPLFTILAKLFTFIPFGSIAWRANLLSAVCDAGAAVFILLAVRRFTQNHWAGLLAAGLFAFSPLIWRYAVVAEVFALNNLLVAAMIYCAVRYAEKYEVKFAYLTTLVFGLGMANHHTCLFYGAPLMVWILITGRRELFAVRHLAIISACFMVGLSPYVYLFLADIHVAPFSWGHTSTLQGFLSHVMRREYGTLQLGAHKVDTSGNFLLGLRKYFSALPGDLIYIGAVLALIGLYFGLKDKKFKSFTAVTLFSFSLYVIVFHALANLPLKDPLFLGVHMRFWQMATLMVCFWAGLGLAALANLVPQSSTWNLELGLVVLAILFAHVVLNLRNEDQHNNTVVRDWGHELLRPIPSGSLVWTKGDLMINVLGYLQQCEGYRTDVRVLDQEYLKKSWMKRLINANYPDVTIPGVIFGPPGSAGYDTKQLLDANVDRFKMFIVMDSYFYETDRSWQGSYTFRPFGMLQMVAPTHQPFDPASYITESAKALPTIDPRSYPKFADDSWESLLVKDYWGAPFNRASFLISYALAHDNNRSMLEAGAAGLENVLTFLSSPPPLIYKQLGRAYSKLAVYDPANLNKMKTAWSLYLQSNPDPADPDLPEIRKAVASE